MVYPYCNVLHSKYERKLKFLAPDKKIFLAVSIWRFALLSMAAFFMAEQIKRVINLRWQIYCVRGNIMV
ncbi:hypothetical protein Plhal703r1_c28g0114531 [Plasmopara halstedii]